MNAIAIWCKFKNYGDWCYQYRIPNESEFIKGFEYEYVSFMITNNDLHNTIQAFWNKAEVGTEFGLPINQIKGYLEAGHVRVVENNEEVYVMVNERNHPVLLKYGVSKWEYWSYLLNKKKGYDIEYLEVYNKYNSKMKLFYYKVEDGRWILERDKETNKITKYTHDLEIKNIIKYIVVEASIVKEGEEFIHDTLRISNVPNGKQDHYLIKLNGEEAYMIGLGKELTNPLDAQPYEVIILGDANKRVEEILPSIPKVVTMKKSFIKLFGKTFKERVKKIMESIKITMVKVLPNERYLGHNKGWKPLIVKPTIQPEKSPDRLVCIATKDRKQYKRIIWKDANELIITQLADDTQWEYIPKEEYKKLNRPTPGLSFIKAQGDNEFQYRMESPRKSHSTKKGTKSRNKWDKHNKIINLSTYEISIEKHDPKSVGPEVKGLDYTITSSSELKAKNRAFKMSKLDINLKPYYNVIVKRSIPIDTNTQPKKNNVSKALFEAKEWVSEFSINKIDKIEGDKIIPSTIKIFKRKYEQVLSPFKKTKKWKCPKKNEKK